MAKTNTDARWLPGADMEQNAAKIRDLLLALSAMLQNYSAEDVKGLIQSIVDLMDDDDGKSIGQQLTNAIENKANKSDLDSAVQNLNNSVTAVDNNKVNKTDFNAYKTATSNTLSFIQSDVDANASNLSSMRENINNSITDINDNLNNANSLITYLENREKYKLICLNGYTKFSGGQATAIINKLSSCLVFVEKDCPNGLIVTDSRNISITGTDNNGNIVPLYAGHLYVFSYISHSSSDDELRLAGDIPINTAGRHWLSGSEIAHIENSKEYAIEGKLGDMYLNIETLCIYRCNGISDNGLYEWIYIGQWTKTSGIALSNLSSELKNTIENKAEKSVVDELSKNIQSLISRPSNGTGGGNILIDTALDRQSANAIANATVANEFDIANDERNGVAYALGSLMGIERIPQLYISDADDDQIRIFNTERVESRIDLLPKIVFGATEFISADGIKFKNSSPSFDISPNDEWTGETYVLRLSISKTGEMEVSVFSDSIDNINIKKNLIGTYLPSTGGCYIDIGWIRINHTDEGWGVDAVNLYDISGAVFLNDLTISNIIGDLSALSTEDKSTLVNAINETNS
ncbi:MAG: hypothetical protein Q4G33_10115, partial [bacterium]|nr:hypothetical protein [bacterium]